MFSADHQKMILRLALFVLIIQRAVGRVGLKQPVEVDTLSCKQQCICVNTTADCANLNIDSFNHMLKEGLTEVDLSENLLTSLTVQAFKQNKGLQRVDLSRNQLIALPHDVFDGLTSMIYLNISFNNISYAILPSTIFQGLNNLKILSMNNQGRWQKSVNPGTFAPLIFVEELHVTGTPSLDGSFSSMVNLKLVDFGERFCNIANMSAPSYRLLKGPSKIEALSFRNCRLRDLPNDTFSNFPSLKRLDLSCNKYIGEEATEALAAENAAMLEVLLLDNVSGGKVKPSDNGTSPLVQYHQERLNLAKILDKQGELQALSILSNKFLVPHQLKFGRTVKKLQYLAIDQKAISALEGGASSEKPDAINDAIDFNFGLDMLKLVHLRIIRIEAAPLFTRGSPKCREPQPLIIKQPYPWSRYPSEPLCNETCVKAWTAKLVTLLTRKNHDKNTVEQEFYDVMPWKELSIASLNLNLFSHSSHLLSCKSDYNYTVHLESLEFDDMTVTTEDEDIILGPECSIAAPQLRRLQLRRCRLRTITPTFLQKFSKLEDLDLSDNDLGKQLSGQDGVNFFAGSSNIRYLDLSRNNIDEMSRDIFSSLTNLEKLDLSDNDIRIWLPSLRSNTKLRHLDLSENKLQYFGQPAFNQLPKNSPVLVITLYHNKFACDCSSNFTEFSNWLTDYTANKRHQANYLCNNLNMTVQQWQITGYISDCTAPNSTPPFPHTLMYAVIPLVAIILILGVAFSVYIKRYECLYRWYSFQRKMHADSKECVPLCSNDQSRPMAIYLAVEEPDHLCHFLHDENIAYYTRYLCSKETGYRWENVAHDIDTCDMAIISLSPTTELNNAETCTDFYFALEKGLNNILTITKGDIGHLMKGRCGRSVRKLLNQSRVIQWPDEDPSQHFKDHLLDTLQSYHQNEMN